MNKFLIVIPSVFTEVTTDYIHQTALQLSKKHCVLVFDLTKHQKKSLLKRLLQGQTTKSRIEKVSKNYYRSYPINCLPLVRFKFVRNINKYLDFFIVYLYLVLSKEVSLSSKRVLWIFHPWGYKQISHLLKFFSTSLLDIVDWFRISEDERIFLSKVSYVFVNSRTLKKKIKKYRSDCKLVPQGFDLDTFRKPIAKIKFFNNNNPVIGYVGGVSKRLDFTLLNNLIKNNPQWNFVLWGPIFDIKKKQKSILDKILKFENVVHGKSIKKLIPSVIASFDIGMIPYDSSQMFNRNCYPMKVFEYIYLRKLVFSSAITELKYLNKSVIISESQQEWTELIGDLILSGKILKQDNEMVSFAIKNSWENKVCKIKKITGLYA